MAIGFATWHRDWESFFDLVTSLTAIEAIIITLHETINNQKNTKEQIQLVKKQLEIEQEPYIVIFDQIYFRVNNNTDWNLKIKNTGRGLAKNITVSSDREGKIALFEYQNPSRIDLGAGEIKDNWKVDQTNIEGSHIGNQKYVLFTTFYDQLNNKYLTKTLLQKKHSVFKVMSNDVEKL